MQARHRFLPGPFVTLAFLLVLAAMLRLGVWQLDRADQKIALQEAARQARDTAPVPLTELIDVELAAHRMTQVSLAGQFDEQVAFLWDNRSHAGQVGYEVIGLFRLSDGGGRVWVNRGWVPAGPSRDTLPDVGSDAGPDVRPDAGSAEATALALTGLVTQPSRGFAQGEAVLSDTGWPRVLHYVDFAAMADAVGEPVTPLLVQPMQKLTPEGPWFVPIWQPAASGPEKHWGYAFQWFAMATALTGLFVLINWRRYRQARVSLDRAQAPN